MGAISANDEKSKIGWYGPLTFPSETSKFNIFSILVFAQILAKPMAFPSGSLTSTLIVCSTK